MRDTIINELRDEVVGIRTENKGLKSEVGVLRQKWEEMMQKMTQFTVPPSFAPSALGLGLAPTLDRHSPPAPLESLSNSPAATPSDDWALDSPKLSPGILPPVASGSRTGTRGSNGIAKPNLSKDVAPGMKRGTGSWTTAGMPGGYMSVHTLFVPFFVHHIAETDCDDAGCNPNSEESTRNPSSPNPSIPLSTTSRPRNSPTSLRTRLIFATTPASLSLLPNPARRTTTSSNRIRSIFEPTTSRNTVERSTASWRTTRRAYQRRKDQPRRRMATRNLLTDSDQRSCPPLLHATRLRRNPATAIHPPTWPRSNLLVSQQKNEPDSKRTLVSLCSLRGRCSRR